MSSIQGATDATFSEPWLRNPKHPPTGLPQHNPLAKTRPIAKPKLWKCPIVGTNISTSDGIFFLSEWADYKTSTNLLKELRRCMSPGLRRLTSDQGSGEHL